MARLTWPTQPEKAVRVLVCESNAGADPETWDLTHIFGGPMQIHRETWADYFEATRGWTWREVVFDLAKHFLAAREIYDRAGGWATLPGGPWPVCGLR